MCHFSCNIIARVNQLIHRRTYVTCSEARTKGLTEVVNLRQRVQQRRGYVGYDQLISTCCPHATTITGISLSLSGDSTADLDYISPFALELPGAAEIKRSSTNPTQDVSLLLPNNGQLGSLGTSGDIWIEASDWMQ